MDYGLVSDSLLQTLISVAVVGMEVLGDYFSLFRAAVLSISVFTVAILCLLLVIK